jgi:dTDP-4-amino-4,6-dideoxygalactose transaminase
MLFARGRHALWHGLRTLDFPPGAEVLVPAYHSGSEVEALRRAGIGCRFYEATESLEPDEQELGQLLDERVAGLYLIHHLGFPQDAARWRDWYEEHGLSLIEDAAQAWLGRIGKRPLGSFGDVSIFAFYKSVGLPDGAAFLHGSGFKPPRRYGGIGLATVGTRHAEWLLARSGLLTSLGERLPPELELVRQVFDPDTSFALGNPYATPSRASRFLLPRGFDPSAVERKRTYERLLLGLSEAVAQPFNKLAIGACFWAFPIETEDRQALLERLMRQRVREINLWSVPHPCLPADRFPGARSWRAHLVGLPVHQELRESDLARLAAAARGSGVTSRRRTARSRGAA